MSLNSFINDISEAYNYKGDSIILGKGMYEGHVQADVPVGIALKTLNRHGLIAGATGTGKTKTLQLIAEQLSQKGIPSLLMDIKGDLSGLAKAAAADNPHIAARQEKLKIPYNPMGFPVELLTISQEAGTHLHATVDSFGPVLLSKILGLNDTQSGILSILFKYASDKGWKQSTLEDTKALIRYASEGEGKQEVETKYGRITSGSIGAILRNIVALEQQGADVFLGEPDFRVEDLLKTNSEGLGNINIIRLVDLQNRPNLFSCFMLNLLSKIYDCFPESGDLEKPKLMLFIDEAHLIFKEASKELLQKIETIVKLIRSKGVGIVFCTQVPSDVPGMILSQLGLKVQHALRGFTAKDRKDIQKAAENYPTSTYYKTAEAITQLGIGEAFVTALNEKGIPTPLVHTYLRAPQSRMDVLSDSEIQQVNNGSVLAPLYRDTAANASSLAQMLNEKTATQAQVSQQNTTASRQTKSKKEPEGALSSVLNSPLAKTVGRTLISTLVIKILAAFGLSNNTRRRRRY